MENYFIIHGTFGNSQENWFPWLEKELNKQGKEVFNLDFPTPEGQFFDNWSNELDKYKNILGKNTTFICHSIGCIFIVKYLLKNKIKVKKCIFVSGLNNYFAIEEFDKLNISFFLDDLSRFANCSEEIICYYSKNDPYITINALKKFTKDVGATKTIIIENGGHFNKYAGYIKFEEILNKL